MKTIKLKCKCGAEFSYEDTKDDFAKENMTLVAYIRYAVEAAACGWLEGHRQCYEGMDKETFALQIKEAWNQGFNSGLKERNETPPQGYRQYTNDTPKGTT